MSNKLTDISILRGLKNLESLFLSFNQLADISSLNGLINLKRLALGSNQISNISVLSELKFLKDLDLSHNQLVEIKDLNSLKALKSLDLSQNRLADISPLSELNLSNLKLTNNEICEFPKWLLNTSMEIFSIEENYSREGINIYNNPIKDVPIELIKLGKEAIGDYFNSLIN